MRPTSQMIAGQINEIDKRAGDLQRNVAALSLDAVAGDKDAAAAIATANAEIAGLTQDRAVLATALERAEKLEQDDREDEMERQRLAHLAAARENAAAALKAARAMDQAIAGLVAAAADLDAAELAARRHVRAAGENPEEFMGQRGASGHGMFLVERIADGSSKRRNDKSVADLVAGAWRKYIEPEKESADV